MKKIQEVYVHGIHPAVAALDFERLKWKLSRSAEASMSVGEVDSAILEYQRFLTLKKIYPSYSLVPNKRVDQFWHQHILDTKAYREDCDSVFGYFVDHFPYFGIYGKDDQQNLTDAFEETKGLYEQHFGSYPGDLDNAARCQDHSCHVPSSCACRVPNTCK